MPGFTAETSAPAVVTCVTADGSATLYRPDLDEHYHSVKGALAESRHVYIDCGLDYFARVNPERRPVRILEIGFGTGLDAMLAMEYARRASTPVSYLGVETLPLSAATLEATGYRGEVGAEVFDFVASAPWDLDAMTPDRHFTIRKRLTDARLFLQARAEGASFDVVFMDAFAPEKQPELWTAGFISALAGTMAPGGVLTTYCAKGAVRRLMQQAGLTVERLPGPPGGKREILRATKQS